MADLVKFLDDVFGVFMLFLGVVSCCALSVMAVAAIVGSIVRIAEYFN